jgi:hypothetical protein
MTMASGAAPGDSNGGGIQNAGTLSLTNCVLDHNQGDTQGFGQTGGIFNTGTLNVINSTISGNIASVSGGILNAGTATISDSNVSGNSGGSAGGGVWNDATLTITNSAISGNSAGEGGGIFNALSGSLSVLNSTLSANLAGGGGGIWNSSSGAVAVINSTLSGNSASSASTNNGNGGGILNSGSQVIISNSTISGNSTTLSGGGIYNGPAAAVSIISSIVALNTAANSGPDVGGSFTSNGFNLIAETDGSTGFTQATDHTGTMASPLDPKLDPAGLQNNGGPTQTIALKSGSSAIDSANPGSVPRDQRGYLRNGAPDIGAFEFGGTIPVSLGNISTRSFVNTGDNVMIGGFIIAGPGNKLVLLRAIGPSLSNPPVSLANTLQDPTISLFNSGGAKIISNDNWADASNAQSIDPALRPSNGLESAILISLAPGAYTAIVSGVNGGTGIGLVEVFDLDSTAASKLINISTRGLVETGDSVMIGGFIIKGPDSDKVVVRAIGPSLASPPFSLTNVLQNPTLSLFDVNGMVFASNDDWRDTQEADIIATGLQPTNDAESAIVTTLVPGNYTAIVRGVGGTTGVALVEVYGLN